MFILRKISGSGVELNFALGRSYTLINELKNKKEFDELNNALKYGKAPACIYAFISDENAKVHQLSDKQQSYIMAPNGNTFANVSKRG